MNSLSERFKTAEKSHQMIRKHFLSLALFEKLESGPTSLHSGSRQSRITILIGRQLLNTGFLMLNLESCYSISGLKEFSRKQELRPLCWVSGRR